MSDAPSDPGAISLRYARQRAILSATAAVDIPDAGIDVQCTTDPALPADLIATGYPSPQVRGEPIDSAVALCVSESPLDTLDESLGAEIPQNACFDSYSNWPFPASQLAHGLAVTYDAVRTAGCPNARGARIALPTTLDIQSWHTECTGHLDDSLVLNGITYGFPLQYTGGPQYGRGAPYNHPSACAYNAHIREYIDTELKHGALAGPFTTPPFTPWCTVSPMMTREKVDPGKRRVIVDLSYPVGGINKYIAPHAFNSQRALHQLPTVDSAVRIINEMRADRVHMAVLDLSRAYRHFRVDPLDWPLLAVEHHGSYYFDKALPFGARMSSFVMQSVAQFIIRALSTRGITALMYLDDLIILGVGKAEVSAQFEETRRVIRSLGLCIADHKTQTPDTAVTWLGILIDTVANEISIPSLKLEAIQTGLADAAARKYISVKRLQSVIGHVNHLSMAVPPARLFMCRLLAALRGNHSGMVEVTEAVRADLAWFEKFLRNYNGRSIIPHHRHVRSIWADSCLMGGGGTDGFGYYSYEYPPIVRNDRHISQLEALNLLAAARAFITRADEGGTVTLHCDNQSTVDVFSNGRAKDPILQACSRALWYLSATKGVQIVCVHIPGNDMVLADALSRAGMSTRHQVIAAKHVAEHNLSRRKVNRAMFSIADFI